MTPTTNKLDLWSFSRNAEKLLTTKIVTIYLLIMFHQGPRVTWIKKLIRKVNIRIFTELLINVQSMEQIYKMISYF